MKLIINYCKEGIDLASDAHSVVLLVEDDPNIKEIYSTILKSNGYNVNAVIAGDEALRVIETIKPKYLLLDLMIPGIPGIELLKTLREDPKYQSLDPQPKIVIITNVADPEMAKQAAKLKVDKYVIKAEISARDLPKILAELG